MKNKITKNAGILPITPDGGVILQERDDKPSIYNPGYVGTFGGSVDNDETFEQAAIREIQEELGIIKKETDLEPFAEMVLKRLRQTEGDSSNVINKTFIIRDINPETLKIGEGKGYKIIKNQEDLDQYKVTQIALILLEEYFK